jgi:hypothetical protein
MRSQQPLEIGEYNLDDVNGVKENVKLLIKAKHEAKIDDSSIYALHALVGDLIRCYLPNTGVNVTVTQQQSASSNNQVDSKQAET